MNLSASLYLIDKPLHNFLLYSSGRDFFNVLFLQLYRFSINPFFFIRIKILPA